MPFSFLYFLKLSVCLAVVFLFYYFILRKLTFYNHNRWYLLAYTMLSFLIPFINVAFVLEKNNWSNNEIVSWVPSITTTETAGFLAPPVHAFSRWDILTVVLIAGMLIMLVRMLSQLLSFSRLKKRATVINVGGMNLYQVNENIIPFSFGNSIFINRHLHNENELQEIIRHEFVHVKQRHSFDIIWGEIFCLLNWYNPFAWLLKKSIRQNLEFIADNKVLENGFNKKQYQYLLLKVIGNNQFSIAPKFNFSSLKKRIAMMNKTKSTKGQLLRLLFLLPATALLLLAFRNKWENSQNINVGEKKTFNATFIGNDTVPPPPVPSKPPLSPVPVKLPDNVQRINVNKDVATVWLKNGKKEIYNLALASEKETFEKKYGEMPPPPVPPTPPVLPVQNTSEAPVVALTGNNEINLIGISNEYEITDKMAVIKLKDGTIEKYDLTNSKDRESFEKKYGKIGHINTNISPKLNTSVNTNINAVIARYQKLL